MGDNILFIRRKQNGECITDLGQQSRRQWLFQFGIDGQVVVSIGSDKGFKVYHTTDEIILDTLVAFVQEHGTEG